MIYIVHYTYIVYIARCLLRCTINYIDITYNTTNESIKTPIVFHVKEYFEGDDKCTLAFWSAYDENNYSFILFNQVKAHIYEYYYPVAK